MKPEDVIETCRQVDNLMTCVFSRRNYDSFEELHKFAKLSGAESYLSQSTIKFSNGSRIRFITLRDDEDEHRNIAGLEIGLAVMNDVYPSRYLKSRMRFGSFRAPVDYGLPKIVGLEKP